MGLPNKLKDQRLYVGGNRYAGEIPEVVLPKLAIKTEAYRGGGMLGEVDIDMGLEKLEAEVTVGGLVADLFRSFGALAHDAELLRFAGAYQAEGGGTQLAEATMRGRIAEIDMGSAKPGADTEHKFKYTLTYYRLDLDGTNAVEIDVVGGTYLVFGVDRRAEINALLGD